MSLSLWFGSARRGRVWSVPVLFLLPLLIASSVISDPVLVADINPSGNSYPTFPISMGDSVYFYANNGQTQQFFVANETGATQLTALADGVGCIARDYDSSPVVADSAVFFSVDADGDCGIDQVWRSDGTPAGTTLVQQFTQSVDSIFAAGPGFYAVAPDGSGARGIWYSDGSVGGARLLQGGFDPMTTSIYELGLFNGHFYVAVTQPMGTALDLWRADTDGATLLDATTLRGWATAAVYQDKLYIADRFGEIWRLSAGSDTPVLWQDGSVFYGYISGMYVIGDRLYLIDWDTSGQSKQTLWRYDGTADKLEEIVTYTVIGPLDGLGDSVYFAAEQYTDDGTRLGGDYFLRLPLSTTTPTSVSPRFTIPGDYELGKIETEGNLLYMQVYTPDGLELWVSDGSAAGTQRVTAIADTLMGWEAPICPCLIMTDGQLYFDRKDAVTGIEMWRLALIEAGKPLYLPYVAHP